MIVHDDLASNHSLHQPPNPPSFFTISLARISISIHRPLLFTQLIFELMFPPLFFPNFVEYLIPIPNCHNCRFVNDLGVLLVIGYCIHQLNFVIA